MSNGWKIVAIIFIILFLLETAFIIWAIDYSLKDEERMNVCYYEVCSGADDAYYENYLCSCLNWNVDSGSYETVKTKYMK